MGYDAEDAQAEADQISLIEKRAIELGLEEGEHYRRGPGAHTITLWYPPKREAVATVYTPRDVLKDVARAWKVEPDNGWDETHEHDREALEAAMARKERTSPIGDPFYSPPAPEGEEEAYRRMLASEYPLIEPNRLTLDPRLQVEGSPLDEDYPAEPNGVRGQGMDSAQVYRDKDKAERVRESMNANRLKGVMRGWGAVAEHKEAVFTMEELTRLKDYVDTRVALAQRFPPEPELNDEGPTVVTFTRTFGGRAYSYAALRVPAGMQEGKWVVTGPQSPAYLTWTDLMVWVEGGTPSTQRVVVHVASGWDVSIP